jgi:hypothetical protein
MKTTSRRAREGTGASLACAEVGRWPRRGEGRYDRIGMTGSAAFRVFLAVYMALWTPAWCCCAIRGGLGVMSGVGGAACAVDGCCSAAGQTSAHGPAEHACCDVDADQPGGDGPSDGPCRCHEIDSDRTRFDTSTRTVLPSLSLAFLLPPLPELVAPDVSRDPVAMRLSLRLDLPPPTSLLAQHCLLII